MCSMKQHTEVSGIKRFMKEGKAAHKTQGKAAEGLVDAETHLVWVNSVMEAGAGTDLVFFPFRPKQCVFSPLTAAL